MNRLTRNKTRRGALLLAVLVAVVLLFSVAYMAGHAGHDCTGEDCEICSFLALCVNTLRFTALMLAVAIAVTFSCVCLRRGRLEAVLLPRCRSLVSLNIELLN